MNQNEDNFDDLRRLLKLKRQETPPPGYFNNFSGQIIARIRKEQAGGATADISWLMKLLQAFEFKPAFAGAFASALCLVLVFGIVYVERGPDDTQKSLLQITEPASGTFAALSQGSLPETADNIGIGASNNAANSLSPVASLFGGAPNQFAQPVSFSMSGN